MRRNRNSGRHLNAQATALRQQQPVAKLSVVPLAALHVPIDIKGEVNE
jgi:hypothetical protein